MKSIILVALSTKFDASTAQAILEIANNSNNPETVVEKILGIYVEPVLPVYVVLSQKNKGVPCIGKLESIDAFSAPSCVVNYSWLTTETRWAKEDITSPTEYNTHYRQTPEFSCEVTIDIAHKSSCSIETWLGYEEFLQ